MAAIRTAICPSQLWTPPWTTTRTSSTGATTTQRTVAGASGTVRGAAVVEVSPARRMLDGSQLEQWFAERGASVKVQSPAPR